MCIRTMAPRAGSNALETIKFSITSHRGCYGECNFCSIGVHEGRTVISRSEQSIIDEVRKLTDFSDFKGYIPDIGGATANMYGMECRKKQQHGVCKNKRCLYPQVCDSLHADHSRQIHLLRNLQRIPGVKKCLSLPAFATIYCLATKSTVRSTCANW